MAPKGPFRLCTVNTAPDRAKRLVGQVVQDVREEYTIDYLENAESMYPSICWDVMRRKETRVAQSKGHGSQGMAR